MLIRFIPGQISDAGLEAGVVIKAVVAGDTTAMLENFWGKGVFVFGDVVELFQQSLAAR